MKFTAAELGETFSASLRDVGGVLETSGQPWMLIGGLAVGAWTEPRATKDCDLAEQLPSDPRTLEDALARIPLRVIGGSFAAVADGGPVRLQTSAPDGPALVVDLLCAGTSFEVEALQRRRLTEVLGVSLYVATPDDLLIYKLIAGRPQDLADIDRLLRYGRCLEDEAHVRKWARVWEVEVLLDRAMATAARDAE